MRGDRGGASRAVFTLTNTDTTALPARGWALYFNALLGPTPGSETGGIVIEQVVGRAVPDGAARRRFRGCRLARASSSSTSAASSATSPRRRSAPTSSLTKPREGPRDHGLPGRCRSNGPTSRAGLRVSSRRKRCTKERHDQGPACGVTAADPPDTTDAWRRQDGTPAADRPARRSPPHPSWRRKPPRGGVPRRTGLRAPRTRRGR